MNIWKLIKISYFSWARDIRKGVFIRGNTIIKNISYLGAQDQF